MNCDLHLHTYFSDGFHSPEYLIENAVSKKLKAISITDHNCIDALPIARKIAEKERIELITGVEITCEGSEILAYFFDTEYLPLKQILQFNAQTIGDVNLQKAYWLIDNGYNISIEHIKSMFGPNNKILGTHLALELKRMGYAQTLQEAFNGIIKKIKIDYKSKKFTTKKVIHEIINANGVAVLPHPWCLSKPIINDFENYIFKLMDYGLVGIETTGAHYQEHEKFIETIKDIAKKYKLVETGGSDFHGLNFFPENEIGKFNVSYSVVEKLRQKII